MLAVKDSCLTARNQAGDGVCLNVKRLITRIGLVVAWELSVDMNSLGRMKALWPNTWMIVQYCIVYILTRNGAPKNRKSMLPSSKHYAGSHG